MHISQPPLHWLSNHSINPISNPESSIFGVSNDISWLVDQVLSLWIQSPMSIYQKSFQMKLSECENYVVYDGIIIGS